MQGSKFNLKNHLMNYQTNNTNNPIISDYAHTDKQLITILESYTVKGDSLENVFINLLKTMNKTQEGKSLYLEIDQVLIKGHANSDLYILFLSKAIVYTCLRLQIEYSNTLQGLAFSLITNKTQPIVRATLLQSTATLRYYEGKIAESNLLYKEALDLVDVNHPRYDGFVINYATVLATQGRLKELDANGYRVLNEPTSELHAWVSVESLITNSVVTGNFIEGFNRLELYQQKSPDYVKFKYEGIANLLKLLSSDLNDENYTDKRFRIIVKAYRSISEGNLEEATNCQKALLSSKDWPKYHMLSFDEYLPIHLELCLKNKGKARLLLLEKQKFDRPHYLDDLFFARIQILENNFTGAFLSFGRLMENISRFEAIHRLMFELQFAKELRLSDLVLLMSDLKNPAITDFWKKKDTLKNPFKSSLKGLGLIIGDSKPIQTVKGLIKKYAPLKEIVLITGATGTGKELVARALHEEGSNQAEPFLAVNCGALTESLLLSELFGYEAGAFTGAHKKRKGIFEAAGKGTVFLDEFGGVSPHLQVSLLRTLESNEIRPIGGTVTRSIHCRIIIATNSDLQQAVRDKKFRDDLYFRISRLEIKLPNLRERLDDLPLLVDYFLTEKNDISNKHIEVSKQLLDALVAYAWPGNIRELKNEMERLKILNPDKERLELDDFDFSHLQGYPKIEATVSATTKINPQIKPNIPSEQISNVNHESVKAILNQGSKAKRRQSFLKELFKEYKQLTRSQIMAIANIGPSTATKELQELIDAGFIERHMPTSSPRTTYFKVIEINI